MRTRSPLWIFWVLLAFGVIGPAAVLLFYIYGFAHGLHEPLSSRARDWAAFGEYVGGALGPFFGFLALLGVLVTLRIQRSESNLDELQRLLASESDRLDAILDSEPRQGDPFFREQLAAGGPTYTIRSLLEIGAAAATSRDPQLTEEKREERKEWAITQIKPETRILNVDLPLFVKLLQQYLSAGGSRVVAAHYESKYALLVGFMNVTGLLRSEPVRRHFRHSSVSTNLCREWGIPDNMAYTSR